MENVVLSKEAKHHDLKCIQPYFNEVKFGFKTFEVRKNDRDFKKGDTVRLLEFIPKDCEYTGEELNFKIGYVLEDYPSVEHGNVVFGLIPLTESKQVGRWVSVDDELPEETENVLWLRFKPDEGGEPPYCGTMLDEDFIAISYYTHWTKLIIPPAPSNEGSKQRLLFT